LVQFTAQNLQIC